MKNTITKSGAKALKTMLLGQIEVIDGMIDCMTGEPVWSGAKEYQDEIYRLKAENESIKNNNMDLLNENKRSDSCIASKEKELSGFLDGIRTLGTKIEEQKEEIISLKETKEHYEAVIDVLKDRLKPKQPGPEIVKCCANCATRKTGCEDHCYDLGLWMPEPS